MQGSGRLAPPPRAPFAKSCIGAASSASSRTSPAGVTPGVCPARRPRPLCGALGRHSPAICPRPRCQRASPSERASAMALKAQIARRLEAFGTTIFTEMSALAQKHGAVNLGQGFPNFDGPRFIMEAAAQAMLQDGRNQYAPMAGVPDLLSAIAQRFHTDTGIAVDAVSEVTVTSGCTEAIAATVLGLVNPGDEVVVFEPFYDSYVATLSMAGAVVRPVTLRPPHFAVVEADLRRAFTPLSAGARTRMVMVNTPHNPTGKVFSPAELQLIAQLCRERDAIAVADEVYYKMVYGAPHPSATPSSPGIHSFSAYATFASAGAHRAVDDGASADGADDCTGEKSGAGPEDLENPSPWHISLATLPGMYERTVTLNSLGKTYSLTGWKVGWAVAPPALTWGLRQAHSFFTFSTPTPLQYGAAAALGAPEAYYSELQEEYRRRKDLLVAGLKDVGLTVFEPQGTYFVMADHTAFGYGTDREFCQHLIEEVGVAAIPPSSFYLTPGEGTSLVRFAFCKDEATITEAVKRLKERLRPKGA